MSGIHNLKSQRVIKAFEKMGWITRGQRGSHVHLTKKGYNCILSIPLHKEKPVKEGLLRNLIKKAGMSVEAFLRWY
jgi:predicted RNA binding protein YcfA (HicA-like mRNA interferase family)